MACFLSLARAARDAPKNYNFAVAVLTIGRVLNAQVVLNIKAILNLRIALSVRMVLPARMVLAVRMVLNVRAALNIRIVLSIRTTYSPSLAALGAHLSVNQLLYCWVASHFLCHFG